MPSHPLNLCISHFNPKSLDFTNLLIKKFEKQKIDSLFGVVKMREHPRECILVNKHKWRYLKKSTKLVMRRQEYENNYYFIER